MGRSCEGRSDKPGDRLEVRLAWEEPSPQSARRKHRGLLCEPLCPLWSCFLDIPASHIPQKRRDMGHPLQWRCRRDQNCVVPPYLLPGFRKAQRKGGNEIQALIGVERIQL